MTLKVYLLAILFRLGATWFPPSAQGNLWQRSPFMIPSPQIEQNEFAHNMVFYPGLETATQATAPINPTQMSSHMFNMYFDPDKTVNEPEDFLEYFRHDLGVNLFHNNWHNANPFDGPLVGNHRRGESFYYMHQQILARYNVERLANGEAPIPSAHDINELEHHIVKEYQLPHFDAVQTGGCQDSYNQMQNWTDNIIQAINQGYAISMFNTTVPMSLDLLGNMIQPSSATPNGPLYGNAHNMGHNNIAYCHYKGNQKLNIQILSDLGDTRTAPRCPVFYRFHTFIDDLFKIFQKRLPEYKKEDLDYPGMEVKSFKVLNGRGPTTQLETFWQMIRMDNQYIRDKLTQEYDIPYHVQHEDFKYEININNNADEPRVGWARIFIAPKFDSKGKALPLRTQRSLFIELDKFRFMVPPGNSTLFRTAEDSSVTVKFDEVFRKLIKGKMSTLEAEERDFCACGWPDHLLLPRGTKEGMKFDLFLMLTKEPDNLNELDLTFRPPNPNAVKQSRCKEAYSYCGKMESIYPDARPMGYPWDRAAPKWAETLADFITPSMHVQELLIKNSNMTIPAVPDISDELDVPY